MDDDGERGYLVAVAAAASWSPRPLVAMLSRLGSAKALVEFAKREPFRDDVGCELLGPRALARIALIDDSVASAALERATAGGLHFITSRDERYPKRLLDLVDPPPVMYFKGCLDALEGSTVAIVGSRAATPYGRAVAADMAAGFTTFGVTVISGLARGIDAAAHQGAVSAGAKSVAVLGSGLQALYPAYHGQLADELIASGGSVVSEFAPHIIARAHQFPMRNRLVAALGQATVVVEAGAKSGALITARLAAELGRNVFAVPGDIGRPGSEGTNGLIKDGAILTTGACDVAAVLGWKARATAPRAHGPNEGACANGDVLAALDSGAADVDELCARSGVDAATASAQLTVLEMQGLVERLAGGLYRKNN